MSSPASSYEVHLGFWTNWSHGKIQGATITLTRQHGGFLIAFLAIFIGMVGKSFWRLACFILHRHFSSSQAQDGLYHQRQAILRNSDTAQDGAWRLLMSMFAWRSGSRARRPVLRLLPIVIAAFVISAAFGVASIFSSNVTSETLNQVLLKGSRCGRLDEDKADTLTKKLLMVMPWQAERATKFLNYGTQCYTNATQTDGCNLYIKPRLPLESKRGNACPFGDNICKLENDNLIMDSGYLDSLGDLGINTPSANRFQLRMVHKCAPLQTQPYMTDYNDSDYGAVKRYMYGTVKNPRTTNPWSFELPTQNAYLPGDNTSSASIPRLEYQLGTQIHYATPNETLLGAVNRWSPIPALRLDDADVHIVFLSAPEIHYTAPVNDAWFSARKNASTIHYIKAKAEFEAFVQDEPLGVMACSHSVQYCNPNLPDGQRCEPLRGIVDPRASANVKKIFTTDSHFAVIKWVNSLLVPNLYTIGNTLAFAGAAALRARYALSYGYSGPLPDNQWQLEAEHWVKGALASLQDMFVTGANGLPEILEDFREPPLANETVARNMCVNQKIVSTSYSSFNVLGVSLILIFGVLIIALDLGLEPAVGSWQRRKYRKAQKDHDSEGWDMKMASSLYSTMEWSATSTLQLQRLAHEEAGYGDWSGCDGDVPVTEPDQNISGLDLRNMAHPKLQQQRSSPNSDWESLQKPRIWTVGRSDTGIDTLVEREELEKHIKRVETETDSLPEMLHAISEAQTANGLALQVDGHPLPPQHSEDWRRLR